ncbi:MAG: serine/threonine-protein kinase, partial [Coriobacteriia bacterium]|nr:serine/threonine-protein kinase [Coriobacteriia bacterium]
MEHELILGRYRPLADLGEGGHGAVTLAFDTKMARRVAIKRIPLSHAGVRRLSDTTGLAEARTTAMLNHPNIVTVHEWDTDSDEAFLIMEHVDGASLAELLDAYAPLDADEAAAVLTAVCSVLAFAHDNGVLHLDLKPENVLVTRDGLVKVADFGVASLTNAAGQAISAGGTLGYMPPEQLRGEKVDVRSDLWALGALSFEVLTGAVPFASDTIEGALYKAEYVAPPSPGEFVPELPARLDEILLTALACEPQERYGDVVDFAADLLPLLGDPAAGREGLAALVAELTAEDEPAEGYGFARVGLWDRLVTSEPLLRRVAAVTVCGWLGWS